MTITNIWIKTLIVVLIKTIFLTIFITTTCFSQTNFESVDLKQISQKKVRQLVRQHCNNGLGNFSQLSPTCYCVKDSLLYSKQSDSHLIKEDIGKVWCKMKAVNLKDIFKGRIISFGFMYSKLQDKIFYALDDCQGIEEGQIVFINLKLLGGLKNLGVGLEITRVDEENKIIQFCYLNNGKSEGTQEIRLEQTNDGYSVITQESKYKSKSKFRDKKLYPFFHSKAVKELHDNLRKMISSDTVVELAR